MLSPMYIGLWTNLRCHGVTAGRTDQLVAYARAGHGHNSAPH